MMLQDSEAFLQGRLRFGVYAMPMVYVPAAVIFVADEQMHTIGIAATDQGEQGAVIAFVAGKPAVREQLEASVVAFNHDQGFPDLAAVRQQKFIA